MTPDVLALIVAVGTPLLTAAATWGAIRADMRNLHRALELEREERKAEDRQLWDAVNRRKRAR